jgi:hypothetical protein
MSIEKEDASDSHDELLLPPLIEREPQFNTSIFGITG